MATTTLEPKARITARIPASVQSTLEKAADYMGLPLNSFLVTAAMEKASDVLASEHAITLGLKDAELFAQLLENPPAPNAALLEAGRIYKEMVAE